MRQIDKVKEIVKKAEKMNIITGNTDLIKEMVEANLKNRKVPITASKVSGLVIDFFNRDLKGNPEESNG